MSSNIELAKNAREGLKALGFSDYNIVIYTTLLKERELDARQLSMKTKVPYSRVYEVLNEMIDKEFILKLDGRPSTYKPRSPIDVLQTIQARQDAAFKENSIIVKDPLMSLFSEQRSAAKVATSVIFGKDENVIRMETLLRNSVLSVDLMLKDFEVFIDGIVDELSMLGSKNVKTRLLLPGRVKGQAIIEKVAKFAQIKFMESPPSNLLIGDGREVLMVAAGDYLKNVSEDMIGMSLANPSTTFVVAPLFEAAWKSVLR